MSSLLSSKHTAAPHRLQQRKRNKENEEADEIINESNRNIIKLLWKNGEKYLQKMKYQKPAASKKKSSKEAAKWNIYQRNQKAKKRELAEKKMHEKENNRKRKCLRRNRSGIFTKKKKKNQSKAREERENQRRRSEKRNNFTKINHHILPRIWEIGKSKHREWKKKSIMKKKSIISFGEMFLWKISEEKHSRRKRPLGITASKVHENDSNERKWKKWK